MNKVIMTNARLVRDVEIKQTQSGMSVVQFSIAVNRMKRKGEEKPQADFFNCVAWNHTAEFIAKYFGKGSAINVEGHLASRSYEKNGQRVYVTEIVCDNVEFTGAKQERPQTAQQDNGFGFGDSMSGESIPF